MAKLVEMKSRLAALEKLIQEYTVIDGELSSLRPGKSVYTRQASGLVFYKTDPVLARSQHKNKLDEMKKEFSTLQADIQKLESTMKQQRHTKK